MGEEKRHEMMATLFGAESDGSEEEEEEEEEEGDDDGGDEGPRHRSMLPYSDDEVEGGGQIDVESEGERVGSDHEREESEAERVESGAEREESDGEHSFEGDKKQKRPVPLERRFRQQVSVSGSEQSNEVGQGSEEEEEDVEQFQNRHANVEEDEVEQVHEHSDDGYDSKAADGVAEMRDVFGDSDEEQEPEDQHRNEMHEEISGSDDEDVQRRIMQEDIVPDDAETHEEIYESDEEQPAERRVRERPVGPPIDIDIPFCIPPGSADKMHVVRVSNIMGIESKPFNPRTYVEEEHFVTDETGHKQRIRLEDNVVRWRIARDRNGGINCESNARFVKWSDGSLQLLIGNEVLDISVQNAYHDQAQLFINNGKGAFQSQGRLQQKMKFMPSSLSSKSHRLLTALVDSRNKKMYKVKNVITNKDPEREKEEAERLQQKRIRSKEDLQRKQEKISRKYTPARERIEPQLSPGYLERELEEDGEGEDNIPRERRFHQLLEEEHKLERRIINVKQQPISLRDHLPKRPKERRPSPPQRKQESEESYNEEPSEYETDGQEEEVPLNEEEEEIDEQEADEEEYEDDNKERGWDDRDDEAYKKRKGREDVSESDVSPTRKPVQRRRVIVSDSDED